MYTELQVTSNFSFLRGASHPEELVQQAKELGYTSIALTDRNTLAGIVRAYAEAEKVGIRLIVGSAVEIDYQGLPLTFLLYPTDKKAYGSLTTLLSLGKQRGGKDVCLLTLDDLLCAAGAMVVIAVPPHFYAATDTEELFVEACTQAHAAISQLYISLTRNYEHNSADYLRWVLDLCRRLRIPPVATNDVHYHLPERKLLQDVLVCIREKTTIQQAGYRLFPNSERCLKSPAEMARLFAEHPDALDNTAKIATLTEGFSLSQLTYEYPHEIYNSGRSPLEHLAELTWQGAKERYPQGIPAKLKGLISDELKLIHELEYEKYFLTCYDIVKFARRKEILCQGRGAAANSAVCYCLGITSVNPDQIDILFARFVSKERNEPPDIDIDFEHERREEVIQYIYNKYGRHRAALASTVVTYRARSAVRDVGKALGLSSGAVDTLAKSLHRWTGCTLTPEDLEALGFSADDVTIYNTLLICQILKRFPRHLSQHVGGFIICEQPLSEIVPVVPASMENRTIIEWDKDDIEVLGMLKIDILALGMLSCIRKALDLVNTHYPGKHPGGLKLHTIPVNDPAAYSMACRADTIGVFQIESRAQMSMLPRLKPRTFYDLVIEIAIVRPGPIHGNMVHPFLRRRNGIEQVHYPDDEVREILGKTLGVPIFQEQAMRLAIVLAGFSPGEAEQLRRAMSAWRKNDSLITDFKERIVTGMKTRGYSLAFAESCVNQLKGFSEYGFPESHAASFALLVYASLWLKCHYPAVFATALLNSQPMGFYAPSQIITDAKAHNVSVCEIDVNHSFWDCAIENTTDAGVMRLGFRLIKGLKRSQAEVITEARIRFGHFKSVADLWSAAQAIAFPEQVQLKKSTLLCLAKADAFRSMKLSRRTALWQIRALPEKHLPLGYLPAETAEEIKALPIAPLSRQLDIFSDYASTALSLKGHPIALIREQLQERGVATAGVLAERKHRIKSKNEKLHVSVAGLSVFRQRPGTAHGVVFITLEDETGMANLIVRPEVFERYQRVILSSTCLLACGYLQRIADDDKTDLVYILATHLVRLDELVLKQHASSIKVRSYSY